ncbi:InlB B-repeat-containing protein [Candidatus Saccharibacteria bacterium]|nr:InlB B-repeat-containing protein [Candidatus Saccharibacteria bacterium]
MLLGGEQEHAYSQSDYASGNISFPGADAIKIMIDYAVEAGDYNFISTDGDKEGAIHVGFGESDSSNVSSQRAYIINNNSLEYSMYPSRVGEEPLEGYDYGFYAKFYPVYYSNKPNTIYERLPSVGCSVRAISGNYEEPVGFDSTWTLDIDGNIQNWYREEYDFISTISTDNKSGEYVGKSVNPDFAGQTLIASVYRPYFITYDGNGATAGAMDLAKNELESNTSSSSTTLFAPNFYKTGYGFAGWSTNQNATVNSTDKIFGPNEAITGADIDFNDHTATLYAVWVESIGDMQSYRCSSIPDGNVTALTDVRDGQTYSVVRQGNICWMMENLRLGTVNIVSKMVNYSGIGGTSVASDTGFNTSITNFRNNSEGYGGVFGGLANPESGSWNGTNYNNLSYVQNNTDGTQEDKTIIFYGASGSGAKYTISNSTKYLFPRFDNRNMVAINTSPESIYDASFEYGNYYTWAAASATTQSVSSSVSPSTRTSICPHYWNLPISYSTSGNDSEYYILISRHGVSELRSFPYNFVNSGVRNYSGYTNPGYYGEYWSASSSSETSANVFNLSGYSMSEILATSSLKNNGYPIRCVHHVDGDY